MTNRLAAEYMDIKERRELPTEQLRSYNDPRRIIMAKNITAKVVGGEAEVVEANTVQDAFNALGLDGSYTATVNGQAADFSQSLSDYQFVSFSEKVKGGC